MQLAFRPLQRGDLPLLATWLARAHVSVWWREDADPASVEAKYGPCIDGADPTEVFVIEKDDRPIGIIQRYLIDDEPKWKAALEPAGAQDNAAGIDYLIGEEDEVGHGTGPEMISAFVRILWRHYPAATQVVVSVQQANRRSWRALEKAGFSRAWAGEIRSDDPSDCGPSYVYAKSRPAGDAA